MTNFEYYKDTILEITNKGYDVAVINNKPVSCESLGYCTECQLKQHENCKSTLTKWFCAEHIEQPKLTKKERQFCELVESGWVCRSQNGCLYMSDIKPIKLNISWMNGWRDNRKPTSSFTAINTKLFNVTFPFIKWSDEEPLSIEDLLKLEVEE